MLAGVRRRRLRGSPSSPLSAEAASGVSAQRRTQDERLASKVPSFSIEID